jgi:hypothetical protein
MPTVNFTSPGTSTWAIPFAVTQVTITCIGGGGSGFNDTDGDGDGGGGGGGGFCRATVNITSSSSLSVRVGSGGKAPSGDGGENGSKSEVTGTGFFVTGAGGERGTDDSGGGTAGGNGASGTPIISSVGNNGQNGTDDDNGGLGGGAGNQNNNSGRGSGGGNGTTLSGTNANNGGNTNGGNYGGGGRGNQGGPAGDGGDGAVRIEYSFAAPTIDSFTKSPTSNINVGDSVNLAWTTSYADNVSINNGVGTVAVDGNTNVSPTSTTTYTLSASGPGGGPVTSSQTVTVCQNPVITSFTVSDSVITTGDTVTLSWTTTGTTNGSRSINQGVGSVAASGSVTVTPPNGTTVYTLTANNCATKSVTATVEVTAYPAPTIDSFSNNPTIPDQDTQFTLTWSTSNATGSVSINQGVGSNLAQDGSAQITATVPTSGAGSYPGAPTYGDGYRDYTLTACNPADSCVTSTLRVYVNPQPPNITLFQVEPQTINLGESVTFSYTTTYALTGSINNSVGSVTPIASGTKTFTPTGNIQDFVENSSISYTLSVEGYGGTETQTTPVTILIDTTPNPWVFTNKTGAIINTTYYASSNTTTPL